MVAAAARVVGHTEPGSGPDDLVLSSLSWFHVLRLTGDQQVVHLMLDRSTANLSLAHLIHEPTRLQGGMDIPDWLSRLAEQPFDADTPTLERVLAGLRGFN
jgi:hypothetical protein